MTNALIYSRISDDRQRGTEREGEKSERHAERCRAYASRRDYQIVGEHIDNDISASQQLERPAYNTLLERIAQGDIDVIIAYEQQRLWRDNIEHALFMRHAAPLGLRVEFVRGKTVEPGDIDDEFVSTIINAHSVMESAKTKQRSRDRQEEAARAGKYHGGAPGYGHGPGRTSIIEDEVLVLKEAAERIIGGESLRSIVVDWHTRGIRTERGNLWTVSKLRGVMTQRRLIAEREHKGNVYPTTWTPILDRDTYDAVQTALTARAIVGRKSPTKHLATGLLRCPKCGQTMRGGNTAVGRKSRYVCKDTIRGGCGNSTVQAEGVEHILIDEAINYVNTTKFKRAVDRAIRATKNTSLAGLQRDIQRRQTKATELQLMYDRDELDGHEYRAMRDRNQAALDELEARLPHVDAPPVTLVGAADTVRHAWDNGWTFEQRRDFLRRIVDYVEIRPYQGGPRNRFDPSRVVVHFRW